MLENTSLTQIHLFYPMLFFAFIVLIITIGLVIKGKSSDKTYTQVFTKSSDNAKDVTVKITSDMRDMHHDVIEHTLPLEYEIEIHSLESKIQELTDRVSKLEKDLQTQ